MVDFADQKEGRYWAANLNGQHLFPFTQLVNSQFKETVAFQNFNGRQLEKRLPSWAQIEYVMRHEPHVLFPQIAPSLSGCPFRDEVLDGWCVFDEDMDGWDEAYEQTDDSYFEGLNPPSGLDPILKDHAGNSRGVALRGGSGDHLTIKEPPAMATLKSGGVRKHKVVLPLVLSRFIIAPTIGQ